MTSPDNHTHRTGNSSRADARKKVTGTRIESNGSISRYEYDVKDDKKVRDNIWKYDTGNNSCTTDKFAYGHLAIFPEKLAADHIRSWSNKGDLVLDPFCGSGTTLKMAHHLDRNYISIDISKEYCEIARKRVSIHMTRQNLISGLDNFTEPSLTNEIKENIREFIKALSEKTINRLNLFYFSDLQMYNEPTRINAIEEEFSLKLIQDENGDIIGQLPVMSLKLITEKNKETAAISHTYTLTRKDLTSITNILSHISDKQDKFINNYVEKFENTLVR